MSDKVNALKQARLRDAEAKAALSELRTAQAYREERHFAAGDDMVNHYGFIGAVDGSNVGGCADRLAFWHRLDPECDMHIEIHSGGGSALAGLYLFGQLRRYSIRGGGSHRLTMTVRGLAASMATVLVQAADERVMDADAFFMVHELSAQTGGKIGEMRDAMKFYERLNDKIARTYVERSGGLITLPEFKAMWTDRDVWMDAEETLSRGFVDRIEGTVN